MRISDWSSDVCSSDLALRVLRDANVGALRFLRPQVWLAEERVIQVVEGRRLEAGGVVGGEAKVVAEGQAPADAAGGVAAELRSEERRVGKEGGSTCRSRWSQDHEKTKEDIRKCTIYENHR